jgi:hypothetical protein
MIRASRIWAPGIAPGTVLLPFASGQFNRGTARTYQTSASTISTAAANVAAYENRGDGYGALLSIEHPIYQQTDTSENLFNWASVLGVTVTVDTTVAPDGATTADTTTWPATSGCNLYRNSTGLGNGPYVLTQSMWILKASSSALTNTRLYLLEFDGSTVHVGSVVPTLSWARYDQTVPSGTGPGVGFLRNGLYGPNPVAAGNVIAWGSQLEIGRYPTSYVPVATVASKSEDVLQYTPAQLPYAFRAGKWSQNVYPLWANTDLVSGDERWLYCYGSNQNGLRFRHNGTNVKLEAVVSGSVAAASGAITIARNAQMPIVVDSAAGIITVSGTAGPTGSAFVMPGNANVRVGGLIAANSELDGRLSEPIAA